MKCETVHGVEGRIVGNRLILLLLGGEKSSQKRDIARAKEYWRDHKRRSSHD